MAVPPNSGGKSSLSFGGWLIVAAIAYASYTVVGVPLSQWVNRKLNPDPEFPSGPSVSMQIQLEAARNYVSPMERARRLEQQDRDVLVSPYRRSDGTPVQSHFRSAPDQSISNNWSEYPNVNPYTGAVGTKHSTTETDHYKTLAAQLKNSRNALSSSLPQLIGSDGEQLGTVSDNRFVSDSLSNEYGTFGNPYSSTSIWNKFGTYGNPYSSQSAYSTTTPTPPMLFVDGEPFCYITKNESLSPRIDPDDLSLLVGRKAKGK